MAMVQHWVYTLGADGKLSLKKAGEPAAGISISEDETTIEVRGFAGQVKAFFGKLLRPGGSDFQAKQQILSRE